MSTSYYRSFFYLLVFLPKIFVMINVELVRNINIIIIMSLLSLPVICVFVFSYYFCWKTSGKINIILNNDPIVLKIYYIKIWLEFHMNWLESPIFRINVLISSTCSYTNNREMSSFWVVEFFWLYNSFQRVTFWGNVVAMELLDSDFWPFSCKLLNVLFLHYSRRTLALCSCNSWKMNGKKNANLLCCNDSTSICLFPWEIAEGKMDTNNF